jgi:hypothetical protein
MTKLRLVLDVDYIPDGTSKERLEEMLKDIASYAADRGLMTGDTAAYVDSWHARVEDRE